MQAPTASQAPPELAQAASQAIAEARSGARPVLLAWSRRATVEPLRLLGQADGPKAYLRSPSGEATAGVGQAAKLTAAGPARLDRIRAEAARLFGRALTCGDAGAPPPRLLGGFAFAADHQGEGDWEGFPSAEFVLPALQAVRHGPQGWIAVHRLVEGREDAAGIAAHMAAMALRAERLPPIPATSTGVPLPSFGGQVVDRQPWIAQVGKALDAIREGTLQKVVLARRVGVPLTSSLAGSAALARVAEAYPECYLYLVEPSPGRIFLGASPELLVRSRGGLLESEALAGSAPRGASPEEDASLADALRSSPKERREHAIVAEAVRAALAAMGGKVEGPAEPAMLRLRNVQHLHTPLRADVPEPVHVLRAASVLHPTPAVGGAPREAALAYIERAERFPRGWYAGAVGWFDARGEGELAVALRCAMLSRDEAWLYAGAGIVAGADPAREWDETGLKLQPMLEALGCPP